MSIILFDHMLDKEKIDCARLGGLGDADLLFIREAILGTDLPGALHPPLALHGALPPQPSLPCINPLMYFETKIFQHKSYPPYLTPPVLT